MQTFLLERKDVSRGRKLRIIISDLNINHTFIIKYIKINNKNYDLNKFKSKNCRIAVVNNELNILPPPRGLNSCELTYYGNTNIKSPVVIDFYLLIIIIVIFGLLSYKLTNYAADFQSVNNKSRTEIIFLSVFFMFLFVPILHIDKSEISKKENRVLAKLTQFYDTEKGINYNWGKEFDAWFNDRFFPRKNFISIYNSIVLWLNNKNAYGYIDEKTKILYRNDNNKPFDKIKYNYNELIKFNDFCKQHNIKLYILVVPSKNGIYPSGKTNKLELTNPKEFIKYIKTSNLNIIYPYNELLKAKENDYVFYKTEHHWTEYGAFIGYSELMKVVKKDFPNIRVCQESDYDYSYNNLIRASDFNRNYTYGSTGNVLGIRNKKKYHRVKYKYYTNKNHNELIKQNIIDIPLHKEMEFYYPNGADLRVILLGTSQNENLVEFIPYTFKYVKRIRNNNVKELKNSESFKIMKYYKRELLEYKPDIIIFCFTFNQAVNLHNLFNME